MISSIVMHGDELNGKGELVNSILKKSCESRNIAFVEHGGISVKDLNNSNLHLNTKGTKKLSHNFLEYLNKDWIQNLPEIGNYEQGNNTYVDLSSLRKK